MFMAFSLDHMLICIFDGFIGDKEKWCHNLYGQEKDSTREIQIEVIAGKQEREQVKTRRREEAWGRKIYDR